MHNCILIKIVYPSSVKSFLTVIGRLPSELLLILEEFGNVSPIDKTKQRWLVYWHTLEE